jgi:hypothetical protein
MAAKMVKPLETYQHTAAAIARCTRYRLQAIDFASHTPDAQKCKHEGFLKLNYICIWHNQIGPIATMLNHSIQQVRVKCSSTGTQYGNAFF